MPRPPAVDVAPDILFVKVPDAKTVKNRLHLDLYPTGRDNALPLERRKVEWHIDAQPGS